MGQYLSKQLLYIIDLLWVTLVTLIKLSILHFYLRVFYSPVFRRAVLVVMGLCIAFWFGAFFGTALFCIPPRALWAPPESAPDAHCGNSQAMYSACASSDLGLDVIVISLPMPVLWRLQLPTAKKVALTFVFGVGFLYVEPCSIVAPSRLILWESNLHLLSLSLPIFTFATTKREARSWSANQLFRGNIQYHRRDVGTHKVHARTRHE